MYRIAVLAVLLFLFSPQQIWPYDGDKGQFVTKLLQNIEAKHGAVFFSQCEWKAEALYRATLVFEVGSTRGILIEAEDEFVTSLADVNLESDGLKVVEADGGVYTYARVHKLISELASYKFRLLMPFKVKDLESARSADVCARKKGKDLDPEIDREIGNSISRKAKSKK